MSTVPVRGLEPGKRAALVVVECQNGMTDPEFSTNAPLVEQVDARGVLGHIAELATAFRAAGLPVLHAIVTPFPGFAGWSRNSLLTTSIAKRPLTVGQPAVEINPAVAPEEGDLVVPRHIGMTAFHGTELEGLLRGLGVETVVLTGVSLNVALLGSTIEAINRGFQVVLPADAAAAATAEVGDFLLENIYRLLATVTTTADVIGALGADAG
ncbi:cysteine hydrolase family protein [Microbacterium sp. No. 7]|uniref:cysteine hydrolase family protein n=1 Tax=Microbacterium sp. No. 7 TaxID=1714373 RepID=UPI0006D0772A|nr:cysteine hydrolase [Microbacterium sp. No. 7]ALJ18835.1 hypothetical protein AOA12_02480 [Microbacterium sp. No. 7]